MNNKGFMMAEVIVVSAIILVFMTGLYLSYGKIFSMYNTRIKYYDSETLYGIVYYRDLLIMNNEMNDILTDTKSNKITNLNSNPKDKLFIVYNPKENLNSITGVNKTYTDYINYIQASINFESNYLMVMERCNRYDKIDCTYAYLEVYDGYEPKWDK